MWSLSSILSSRAPSPWASCFKYYSCSRKTVRKKATSYYGTVSRQSLEGAIFVSGFALSCSRRILDMIAIRSDATITRINMTRSDAHTTPIYAEDFPSTGCKMYDVEEFAEKYNITAIKGRPGKEQMDRSYTYITKVINTFTSIRHCHRRPTAERNDRI